MEPKAIKLNYRSAERFSKDYALLKSGRIFLPSKTLLPLETALTLNFTVPGIDNVFTVEGVVAKTIDEQAAAILQKPTGMVLEVVGGPDVILNKLNAVLCRHIDYQILLGLMPPAESAPPAADTHPVSHQADSELNDLDEAALEDEGE
ncbi:MAG: hypothetical protein OES70_13175, partial [Desulfobacterales bacterium]|nr:hypothetical protein [Desulfobacterales bacterium]